MEQIIAYSAIALLVGFIGGTIFGLRVRGKVREIEYQAAINSAPAPKESKRKSRMA